MNKLIVRNTKKEDVRIQRTKEWLYQALIQLSQEIDFEKITVSRLSKKAGIARQTFYRNYNSIGDILEEKHTQIRRNIFEVIAAEDFSLKKMIDQSIEQWYVNKEFFILLEKANLLMAAISAPNNETKAVIGLLKKSPMKEGDIEFLASFLSGGFLNILKDWIAGRLDLTKEEMKRKAYQLVCPIFEAY